MVRPSLRRFQVRRGLASTRATCPVPAVCSEISRGLAIASSARHPYLATPAELQERLRAERLGKPFLVYRDEGGAQQIVVLGDDQLTVGRDPDCDISVAGDRRVSSLHAL